MCCKFILLELYKNPGSTTRPEGVFHFACLYFIDFTTYISTLRRTKYWSTHKHNSIVDTRTGASLVPQHERVPKNHRGTCHNPAITWPNLVAQVQPLNMLHGPFPFPTHIFGAHKQHVLIETHVTFRRSHFSNATHTARQPNLTPF